MESASSKPVPCQRFCVLNLYEAIRTNRSYNKLEIGDFLFAEYTCGATAKKIAKWTDTDYLVHVVTGAKTWHTPDGIWKANPGQTLFFKKGAAVIEQHLRVHPAPFLKTESTQIL